MARSRVPILVRGETGTGKEVIASAIHQLSGRPGRFVAVNCGALAPNLVESELFGYRKGAFSGATEDRPGLVRSSDHGTLLLDEIGDTALRAGGAPARAPGGGGAGGRRHPSRQGGPPGGRLHSPRPRRARSRRPLPRRSARTPL